MSTKGTTVAVDVHHNRQERRVLVLASDGRDGALVCSKLAEAGFAVDRCGDIPELCVEIGRGAAAVLLVEEALSAEACPALCAALAEQPTWSDLPLLLLRSGSGDDRNASKALRDIEETTQLTRLEQPLHDVALTRAVRAAIQSRFRQYHVREELAARKRAEEQLRQSERRYRESVENVNNVIIRWDRDGRLTFFNEFAERFFGYRADEVIGKNVGLLLPRQTSPGSDPSGLVQAIIDAPERYATNTNENVCRDGRRVWMAWTNRPVFDQAGNLTEILAVGTDITEQKAAEASLELQAAIVSGINRIFREALRTDNAERLGEVCLDVAEEITQSRIAFIGEINPVTGLLDDIAISNPGWAACKIDTASGPSRPPLNFKIHGIYGRVIRNGEGFFTNEPDTHPDRIGMPPGHPPIESFLGVPLVRDGKITGMIAVGNRPTGYTPEQLAALESLAPAVVEAFARQEVESALRENREDLARAQVVGQIGSWRLDVRRNVLTWSEENYRIFGLPPETPLSYETFLEAVHPDDRAYVDERWKATLRGQPYDIEHRLCVNGEVRWVREKAFLERDSHGELKGGFGTTQDITDRKLIETELQRLNDTLEEQVTERTAIAERRARELRRLAAELSKAEQRERERLARLLHDDLQQLLLAAKLRLPVLLSRSDPEQIRKDAAELDRLLSSCMSTSRNLTCELSPPILLRGKIAEVLEWLGEWFGEKYGLSVTVQHEAGLPALPKHLRVFLFQAVRELLLNVTKHSGKMKASVSLNASGGNIIVQVEDVGEQFDAKAIEARLERPEGFGLFNICERLDALRGHLKIQASEAGGGCFRLTVPVGESAKSPDEEDESTTARSEQLQPENPNETAVIRLLVVDDHNIVREGLVGLLDGQPDIEVVGEAAGGIEAIRQAENLMPDAITMDIDMPDLDGIEATRKIKERFPETVVVGLSLHEDAAVRQAMAQAGAAAHLSKHSSTKDIVETIRQVCRRRMV